MKQNSFTLTFATFKPLGSPRQGGIMSIWHLHSGDISGTSPVGALRACLTASFTPFGRSGRVTHALAKWLDSASLWSLFLLLSFFFIFPVVLTPPMIPLSVSEILGCDAFCDEDVHVHEQELGILVVGLLSIGIVFVNTLPREYQQIPSLGIVLGNIAPQTEVMHTYPENWRINRKMQVYEIPLNIIQCAPVALALQTRASGNISPHSHLLLNWGVQYGYIIEQKKTSSMNLCECAIKCIVNEAQHWRTY